MDYLKNISAKQYFKNFLTVPFIYWAFFWFVFFDLIIEIYHRICFPLYGIKYVKRGDYFKFDRHRLWYLNKINKINCLYCSYWNWLINYAREIVWRTEKHWCGIKHATDPNFVIPSHHNDFLEYWDEEAFLKKYWKKRKKN